MLANCFRSVPIFCLAASKSSPAVLGQKKAIGDVLSSVRCFTRQGATQNIKTRVKSHSLKERLMAPATDTPFTIGKIGLALGSGVGVGALCFYGLGLSSQVGTIDKMGLWPSYVRERIQATYGYLGGSLALTAAAAAGVARTPVLMNLAMKNGLMSMCVSLAALIGTGSLVRSLPYTPDSLSAKHMAWMLHLGVMGGIIAPLTLLGGPVLMRAGWYTAGVVGGMSAVAYCAPSEKFLNMGGVLGAGLGAVFVASIGSAFLPPTTALGAGMYSIAMYGGLVLFSAFLLYDTQRVIRLAEAYPPPISQYGLGPYAGDGQHTRHFDPLNACLSIYLDTINIFIRIAMILAGGGNKKR